MAGADCRVIMRLGFAVMALTLALPDPLWLLSNQPRGAHAEPRASSEKEAFAAAKDLGTIDAWNAFLSHYPNGFNADLARAYLNKLTGERPASEPPRQTAAAAPNDFPVEAGSWGGIVRSGPGQDYAKQDSLSEGETVSLMGVAPELDNGYPWFKIWYGKDQRKGYMWGGILCAKGAERPDVYKTCTAASPAANPSQGPSCAQTGNRAEQTICASSQLSKLDRELNSEYSLVIENITSEAVGGTEADVKRFRQEQRDWIKKRDRCGSDAKCLTSQYRARLEILREHNQPE